MAKNRSIEEQVEDLVKLQLTSAKRKYYTKTEPINEEIDEALKKAPSKQGGSGRNFPDLKLFVENDACGQTASFERKTILSNGGVVAQDIKYKSPSLAARVVKGCSANGWYHWKEQDTGKTLEEARGRI